ncbi:vegetative cell wall protein precursor [Mycolicibacterium sp. CH28]|uniref:DUF5631 domain-containing protein n=1 Tax=Mycolicibacterium sp. CH28 TaxID=2512237 RepID=UPI00108093CD|nr:DUF5631 domain-containing protein [Mycolicibacterium sp. CH28]TGD84502.1 vegetative cell wall protein precursor [Mycolicibacterium sp. CH28]
MAIFGRNTARRRLKRATQQALSVPTFDAPADCTPWVIGGLWPAELETVTPATAPVAEYLKNDLQRIADSANQRLRALHHSGLPEAGRRAEEARIINVGRAFAVLRVESTVRHLRSGALGFVTESLSLSAAPDTKMLRRPVIEDTQVIEAVVDVTDPIIEDDEHTGPQAVQSPPEVEPDAEPVEIRPVPTPVVTAEPEPDDRRLARLLAFVARQEPGLRWAIGEYTDGTTVLVTDLAYGWIPPGVDLPAGVGLVAPARRGGRVAELLGEVVRSAVYHPGDPFAPIPHEPTVASSQGRAVPPVDDLGWKLVEATHWRDGLPRMVHTLAKAGAARTGVVEAEVEVLRVHCDTARYQLMAQYPDVDPAMLSNCLLLAATEAIAVGDQLSANYHFAWFEALSTPPTSRWGATT